MKLIDSLLPVIAVTVLAAEGVESFSSAMSEAVEQLIGHRAHMTNQICLLAGAGFEHAIPIQGEPAGYVGQAWIEWPPNSIPKIRFAGQFIPGDAGIIRAPGVR